MSRSIEESREEQFERETYDYFLDMLNDMDADIMAMMLAKWMSYDTLRACLDANELSPRHQYAIELAEEEYND